MWAPWQLKHCFHCALSATKSILPTGMPMRSAIFLPSPSVSTLVASLCLSDLYQTLISWWRVKMAVTSFSSPRTGSGRSWHDVPAHALLPKKSVASLARSAPSFWADGGGAVAATGASLPCRLIQSIATHNATGTARDMMHLFLRKLEAMQCFLDLGRIVASRAVQAKREAQQLLQLSQPGRWPAQVAVCSRERRQGRVAR